MTWTVQSRSRAYLSETGKNFTINKPEIEDSISLLLQLFDILNILCEKYSRLEYLLQRKNQENTHERLPV